MLFYIHMQDRLDKWCPTLAEERLKSIIAHDDSIPWMNYPDCNCLHFVHNKVKMPCFWWLVLGGGEDLQMKLVSFYECRFNGRDTMRWW